MELEWTDKKTKTGEAGKCHARLPGSIGWVNLTEYECAGARYGYGFSLHYMVDKPPDGLPSFSGMIYLDGWTEGLDGLKSAAPKLMAEDMAKKIRTLKARIESIRHVRLLCEPA